MVLLVKNKIFKWNSYISSNGKNGVNLPKKYLIKINFKKGSRATPMDNDTMAIIILELKVKIPVMGLTFDCNAPHPLDPYHK